MSKSKSAYFCRGCGFESPKWIGKCPGCAEWNTFQEELMLKTKAAPTWSRSDRKERSLPRKISDIGVAENPRILLGDKELNLVLGGGLVPGSVVLLGGEPGIGKSTLMLQIALQSEAAVLYISGEESEEQIKLRAERLGVKNPECAVLTETLLENILSVLKASAPDILIIDSIQTMYTDSIESTPGTVSQIRECTGKLLQYAKESHVPVFLIGHITKDGSIAGPKLLEHMVDTVLQFEGDRHHAYRILRTHKNRFGSTNEMGIYEMTGEGLRGVDNPSEILLAQRDEQLSGISVAAVLEGNRPLMIETQALVSSAVYGTPQRSATGYDLRRMNMLLAVLEKRCGFRLGAQDVFVNIAGGIRLEDPAMDLGVMAAIMSSYQTMLLPSKCVFAAEVGLSGEIRAVQRIDQRISEAEKLGFEEIVVSKYNKIPKKNRGISIREFGKVDEVFEWVFG